MKKRLLLGLLAAFATVSSFAQAVNTKTGCFVIAGENVCTLTSRVGRLFLQ